MDFPVELTPPLLGLAAKLGVRAQDIDEQWVRGSGAGGQKINKTNSCVQLRHRPTGIEVRVQEHREQSKNRRSAYKLLILKIDEATRGRESHRAQAIFKLRKQKQRRSRKAKEKVLHSKKLRSETKERRRAMS